MQVDYLMHFISNKTRWILILASMFCSGVTLIIFYPYFFFFFFISVNSFTCLSTLLGESISLTDSLKNVFDQYFHIPDPIFFLLCLKIYQLTIISFFLNIVVFIIFLRIFGNIWYYLMIFLISIILKKPHYIMRLPERQLAHFCTRMHQRFAIYPAPFLRLSKVFPCLLSINH